MACPAINSPANWEADDLDTIDRPLRRLNFAAQSLKCGWKICCFVKGSCDSIGVIFLRPYCLTSLSANLKCIQFKHE